MYFEDFNRELRRFIIDLIGNPVNMTISNNLTTTYNITKEDLIYILLKRGVIQQVDDYSYVIPSRNFERKLKKLHILFDNQPDKLPINEDEGGDIGGAIDMGGVTSADNVNSNAPIGKLTTVTKK